MDALEWRRTVFLFLATLRTAAALLALIAIAALEVRFAAWDTRLVLGRAAAKDRLADLALAAVEVAIAGFDGNRASKTLRRIAGRLAESTGLAIFVFAAARNALRLRTY